MKMKAVILFEAGAPSPYTESRPLRVEEVDLGPPQANEVLVRIGGAGLCHSDLSIINASVPRALPMVLGHEGSGEVVEVGVLVRRARRRALRAAVAPLLGPAELEHEDVRRVRVVAQRRGAPPGLVDVRRVSVGQGKGR